MSTCTDVQTKKRVRAPNFTLEETRLLLKLALEEKNVLENKKTDSESWKLKDDTWRKITDLFNSSSGQMFRSTDNLRQKYDSMKKGLKKKINKNKAETMKTGGGKPEYIIIDGPEKELLELLSITMHGLPSCHDSDSMLPETTITGEKVSEATKCEGEIFSFPSTSTTADKIMEEVNMYDNVPVIVVHSDGETFPEVKSDICTQEHNIQEENKKDHQQGALKRCLNPAEVNSPKEMGKNQSWRNWSPVMLKTRKHPALTPRKTKETHSKKMDVILELREELLRKQIASTENEERRAQEKHNKEMELLSLSIQNKYQELQNRAYLSKG